ncbi:DUF4878 domain-containing protein [Dactylosporangium vinaceum]|uniref:DUF4878 domain-containing protein n=1 Tax=Dactylosporangium vinaceum TaxID=53362 RepID=A0ABV5M6B5_9ACTN|nr:hypothetical protein [Dactylosporangium vinaceum]UAB97802.1 DUF4878 domain-containing protein [Dactylosporangium vinaceum]
MSRTWKIILFSAIGVFVLCVAGFVGGIFFVIGKATDAPKAATADFLSALEGGNVTAAYGMLCTDVQERYDSAAFAAYVENNAPTAHKFEWGGSYSNNGGYEEATISGSVTTKNGTSKHDFQLVKERGAWKQCSNPY